MNHRLYIALYAAALIFSISDIGLAEESAGTKNTALKHIADFQGGKLFKAGEVRVLVLTGNYRQMGRQYGALLKDDLQAMHTTIGEVFLNNPDEKRRMHADELKTMAQALFNRYPQRYKQILYGMAETSGLGMDKILLVNALEWFPKINRLRYGKCSGIAVWGPYTNGPVIFGRNDDDDPAFLAFARPVVAVFKPNDGSIPAALINYPGVIYNATGMNADGLFMELNAGNSMGFSMDRVSIFTTLFLYLQEYHNLAELDRAMRSTLVDIGSIITVADPTRGYSYECSLWDTKRRDQDADGIVAAANGFSLPDWNITPLDPKKDPEANEIRKGNLLKLASQYKGAITPDVMMKKIMDVDIKDGGATHAGTIFQVVAAPADRKVWVKVPGRVEWTEVSLEPLFRAPDHSAAKISTATAQSATSKSLDTILTPYLAKYNLPALAAAVVRDGRIVAAGAVGTRRAGANIPVTLNDRFHIGSDTKAFTALLAAMMVEEGKLRWTSTIAEVLPDLAAGMDTRLRGITLEQLLSHSSGLPSDNEQIGALYDKAYLQQGNLDEVRCWFLREAFKFPLKSEPGTQFAYSNTGYITVGAMVERVAGKTWEELIRERIFNPMGLSTAGLWVQASVGKVDAPLPHAMVDGKLKALLASPCADGPMALGPAGLAHMSILDFARWVGWNAGEGKRGPALVRPETLKKLHTPVIEARVPNAPPGTPSQGKYALGWGIPNVEWAVDPLVQHAGSNTLNLAQAWFDPKRDAGFVIATNIGGEKADAAFKVLAKELYTAYMLKRGE